MSENSQRKSLQYSRQLISQGHINKLLDRSQNNWENFLLSRKNDKNKSKRYADGRVDETKPSVFGHGDIEEDASPCFSKTQNQQPLPALKTPTMHQNSVKKGPNTSIYSVVSDQPQTFASKSIQQQSFQKRQLGPEDFERIKEFEALPRAFVLKNLIKQRLQNPQHELHREELNFITQGTALYSANPINSVLENQIEFARAASRGNVDYDRIVRNSVYSDPKPPGNADFNETGSAFHLASEKGK